MIMAVDRIVFSTASRSMPRFRRLNDAASTSAPTTPSAAASVGVASPA